MHISDFFKQNFLIDTHAHLNSDVFKDNDSVISIKNKENSNINDNELRANSLDNIIDKCLDNNVLQILDVAVSIESSIKSINISKKYSNVKSFIGIDPEVFEPNSEMFIGFEINDKYFENVFSNLEYLILKNREDVFGIGESGLDYYHNLNSNLDNELINKSKQFQERLFKLHLELASKYNLPLTIHSRGAEIECLNIIKKYNVTGIFHSYTGDYSTAKSILDLGWGLGVNGIFTFKKANEIREMYKKILGKLKADISFLELYAKGIFFETDSPYLSPEGKRGETNTPVNVLDIYNFFIKELSS